CLQANSTPFTF
nr:immunoglobulin light chain junction region [Macaca mulatta]MOY03048.1 immunoglobulin light chain junction region [Macaca mulatta]